MFRGGTIFFHVLAAGIAINIHEGRVGAGYQFGQFPYSIVADLFTQNNGRCELVPVFFPSLFFDFGFFCAFIFVDGLLLIFLFKLFYLDFLVIRKAKSRKCVRNG